MARMKVMGWGVVLACLYATAAIAANVVCDEPKEWEEFFKRGDKGRMIVERWYPHACSSQTILLLEKEAPTEVNVGENFEYEIRVTNMDRSKMPLFEVAVEEYLETGSVEIVSSAPKGVLDMKRGVIRWDLGKLKYKETRTITVTARALREGITICNCVVPYYVKPVCLPIEVKSVKLSINKTLPATGLVCDYFPLTITVSNNGTAPAENVVVNDALPEGMETKDGKKSIDYVIGTLAPGKSDTRSFEVHGLKAGIFTNTATAKANNHGPVSASATLKIDQPVLAIVKTAMKNETYLGKPFGFTIEVRNTGACDAQNVVLTDNLPSIGSVSSVSDGGQVRGGTVTWSLGTLKPGESKTVTVNMVASAKGESVNTASAMTRCGVAVTASAKTTILGVPAILLEVIDQNDPVMLNGTEVYTIVVTNQGSAEDTNVKITCQLEDAAEFVSATGITQPVKTGNVIEFAPLPSLAPGAKATWQVTVKAVKIGDIRFKATLNSDILKRPVEETEATHFYDGIVEHK